MGAIQGERVGEQFGLRSNEAWVSEERPSSQQHPSFPPLLSQIGRVYNTTCSREQTQNVEGMGISLLSPFFLCSIVDARVCVKHCFHQRRREGVYGLYLAKCERYHLRNLLLNCTFYLSPNFCLKQNTV